MPDEEKVNPTSQARNNVYKDFDAENRTPEVKEESKPAGEEPEQPKAEPKQEKEKEQPKRKLAGKFESVEELEGKYEDAIKGMNEAQRKAAEKDKAFEQVKQYVDWDRLQRAVSGIPQNQPVQGQVITDDAKQKFFEDFANRGPMFLDERMDSRLKAIVPHIVQAVSWQTKLADAYEDFVENNPDLKQFEEQIGRLVVDKVTQNPQMSIKKAMREAVVDFRKTLESIRDQGKKEAQVAFEEKKKENIPKTERASKEPEKEQLEKPESLDDVVTWRLRQKDRYQSVRKRPEI